MINSQEEQTFSVNLHTRPDVYTYMSSNLQYDRVIGAVVNDGVSNVHLGDIKSDHDSQTFMMPKRMATGLGVALSLIENIEHINCHLFSRLTKPEYIDEALVRPTGESWYPIDKYTGYRERVTSLGMGAIGVIRLSTRGLVHSLVGLAEETGKSIQVLSHGAELAIASNQAVSAHYQEINPEAEVGLFEVVE